jgi:16S rRNA processing protein RimM
MRSHGLDGSLRIQSLSDNPNRFGIGTTLNVAGESRTIATYQSLPNGQALVRLHGLEGPSGSHALAGEWIFAPIDSTVLLLPGEYYHYQLIGLSVITDEGETLGIVREILTTGSNDVYVVRSKSGTEILLPAISQVVKQIDLESGAMLVHLIDGLR